MEAEFSVWTPPVDSRHFREACGVQQVQVWSKVLTQPITDEVVPFPAPFPETPLGKEIEGSSSNFSILRKRLFGGRHYGVTMRSWRNANRAERHLEVNCELHAALAIVGEVDVEGQLISDGLFPASHGPLVS